MNNSPSPERKSLSAVAGQDLRNILLLFLILQEDELRFFRVPKSTAPSEDKDLLDSLHLILS